ncbi:hypothetical protein QFC19_002893 [Naganishia cerealis]|uniref:Uncharacterized protein n=1 Tax=Naganishia cerealis TaxID=610337 RepID=A0ACC2W740_9TREE|nr:hypothetical protein QFC19_002893 [Naganishia cerealis]
MLLTELILSKDNALSQVWIAAHYERKLSKQQALRISVQDSVQDILSENAEPTALRMSGQLMLGVVRIYSRKTQYLFDDCKDVRDRITLAFRPGQVDLPADQVTAHKSAITITEPSATAAGGLMMTDLTMMNLTWNEIAKNFQPLGIAHLANQADITLPFGGHYAASARSSSVSRESEYGGVGRAGTVEPFDQGAIDLGLDLGAAAEPEAGDVSIEYGREAGIERAPSIGLTSLRAGHRASSVLSERTARSGTTELAPSVLGAGQQVLLAAGRREQEMELEAPGDLGLDLGEGFELPLPEAAEAEFGLDVHMVDAEARARARRESTALSTPPPEGILEEEARSIMADITPRTANRIAQMAEAREKAAAANEARKTGAGKKTVRLPAAAAAVDEEIELDEQAYGRGAGRRDVSSILGKENYISGNEAQLALERIQQDPAAFYNPTVQVGNQTFFMATPAGVQMAPELSAVFMIPTNILRRRRAEGDEEAEAARKRTRLGGEEEEEEDVEAGRRVQRALSERFPTEGAADVTFDSGLMGDVLDIPDVGFDVDVPMLPTDDDLLGRGRRTPTPSVVAGRERLSSEALRSVRAPSTIAAGDTTHFASLENCEIGFFDTRLRHHTGAPVTESSASQAAASQYLPAADDESSQAEARQRGYSRNTVQAAAFLRGELGGVDEGKTISFQEKAKNVGPPPISAPCLAHD